MLWMGIFKKSSERGPQPRPAEHTGKNCKYYLKADYRKSSKTKVGGVDFPLHYIEKIAEKGIFLFFFSLLLSPFNNFQFHLHPNDFF